jgi:hypothetical protein
MIRDVADDDISLQSYGFLKQQLTIEDLPFLCDFEFFTRRADVNGGGWEVGWGVYRSTWDYREGIGGGRSGGGLGKFTIAGRVVNNNGNGVADLELQVGKPGATGVLN